MPIEILMPALSPTMEEGTLSKWLVVEGDTVSSGDLLAEIETDKAAMEIEAVEEGIIAKILVAEGSEGVKVNAPIALLLEEGEDADAADGYKPGAPIHAASESPEPTISPAHPGESRDPEPKPSTAQPHPGERQNAGKGGIKASPLAKRIAKDKGLDLAAIKGTGPSGRIIKRDVENVDAASMPAPQQAQSAPASAQPEPAGREIGPLRSGGGEYLEQMGIAPGTYDLVPLDGMRRAIAKNMTASAQNVPHFPLNIDLEIDALLAMRKELNNQAPEGIKISVNDMIIRASAIALRQEPDANASYTPDGIAYHHNADVSVAVAVDGGLITPIVSQAQNKGLATISAEMKDLAARAQRKKLKPHEYQGGTFTISNLGMMGIKSFGSIINQPQGMILSVGAGAPRPVVKEGALAVATIMSVTLTCDHRVVDGAVGARWLGAFKRLIEHPMTMML